MSRAIDTHAHVISPDIARYPRAPIGGGEQSGWSRERPVSFDGMTAAMDEAGVARTVLVQASTCYGHDNSYVADAAAAHPERFAGVFSVDVLASDAQDRIRYWMKKRLHGMRVFVAGHTAATDARLDDPAALRAWKCATEAGIPICVQMRGGLDQLDTMLRRFPDARVVLDHMARPSIADGPPYLDAEPLFRLARHRKLYLKLTSHNIRESRQGNATPSTFFTRVVKEFGAARIAWGSNYPASEGTLAGLLEDARDALSSLLEEDQDWIFFRTAQTLWPASR